MFGQRLGFDPRRDPRTEKAEWKQRNGEYLWVMKSRGKPALFFRKSAEGVPKVRLFVQNRSRKYRPKVTVTTLFPTAFQLLPQTPHVRFHGRKWVHTRPCSKDRTQRHTRRNRGLPDGAAITTLDTYCTFTNIPGPGVRTAYFAAFGSWPGVLPKNAESLRNSDALMRVAVPRRRGPAGLRNSTCLSGCLHL